MSSEQICSETISAVSGAISKVLAGFSGYVKKDRRVEKGGNYNYASEAAFIDAIRPLFVGAGLIVQMVDMERELSEFTTKYGAVMQVTRVRVAYRIIHAPSGEWLRFVTIGEGMDVGDKSGNKAMTGAYKYLLREMCITATGDDPDRERPEEERPEPSRPQHRKTHAPSAPPVISEANKALAEYGAKNKSDADALCRVATEQADGSVAVQTVAAMRQSPALAEAVLAGLRKAESDLGSKAEVLAVARRYADGGAS